MVRRNRGRKAARRASFAVQPLESRVLFSGAAPYVIHVSVDGLRPDAVTQLGATRLPNFHRLRAEGAFTDNARTDYDYTITLPNHATQLTGRYVAGAAGHNWVTNDDPAPGETLHSNKQAYLASAWDVAHDAGLRTGLYSSKTKFSLFDESYDDDTASTADPLQSGAPDADPTGGDNGRDKIDRTVINTDSLAMTDAFVADMADAAGPLRYALVHYHDPDTAGHASGWMGDSYFAALELVDAQLGRILSLVAGSATLAGKTAIVLTADHGGEGAGHGDAADPEAYTIPFYVWGPGVTAGGDLYRMNADTRTDPGTGRPDNAAVPQPIRDGDAANLAMDFLGLASVPGSFFNAAQDLKVDVYSPPPPVTTTLAFQQGLDGYAGTVDTQVQSYGPNGSHGSAAEITVDGDEPPGTGHDSQGLVRFDDIFGNGAGQIPDGSEVVSATLQLNVVNPGTRVNLHRMLADWSGADTWNTLDGGVSADGYEAVPSIDASFTPSGTGVYSLDVTASLAAWSADPTGNKGWVFLPADGDGVDFHTSDGSVAPKLVVSYSPPPDLPVVSVAAGDAAAAEPGGLDDGQFTVSRGGDTTADLTVAYTVGGTATAGSDYAALGGFVTIPAGQTSAVVDLAVQDDSAYEGDETAVLTLSAGTGYAVASPGSATVTIADDELPPPLVTVSATDATASEAGDTATYTVSRDGDLSADLVVAYSVGGTATAGGDYQSLSDEVTIPAGQSSATFSVVPIDDAQYEGDETVVVTLADGAAYDPAAPQSATVVIASDDVEPVAPAAPTELTAKAYAGGRIDLFWKDNSANETSFVIEWSSNGKTWATLDTVGADVTAYTKTGLAKSTFYYFRVKAVNAYGSSAWSNVLKIRSAAK